MWLARILRKKDGGEKWKRGFQISLIFHTKMYKSIKSFCAIQLDERLYLLLAIDERDVCLPSCLINFRESFMKENIFLDSRWFLDCIAVSGWGGGCSCNFISRRKAFVRCFQLAAQQKGNWGEEFSSRWNMVISYVRGLPFVYAWLGIWDSSASIRAYYTLLGRNSVGRASF